MIDRVQTLGGTIEITTDPALGTTIAAELPLDVEQL
jgi:signal transduction histidine kinase